MDGQDTWVADGGRGPSLGGAFESFKCWVMHKKNPPACVSAGGWLRF